MLSAGYSYRLRADRLHREFEHNGPLPRLLLRYTRCLVAQIGLISACKRHHSLEHRFCRWMLSCLDRSLTTELALTQEMIADMLGVRREGVTEAVGKLQRAGLIDCSRGHIAVHDRAALEAHACECYAVVRREYEGLLADYRQAAVSSPAHAGTRVPRALGRAKPECDRAPPGMAPHGPHRLAARGSIGRQ